MKKFLSYTVLSFLVSIQAYAIDYYRILYTVKKDDTFASIIKTFVSNDSVINSQNLMIKKTIRLNPQVKSWHDLTEGQEIDLYISRKYLDLKKVDSYYKEVSDSGKYFVFRYTSVRNDSLEQIMRKFTLPQYKINTSPSSSSGMVRKTRIVNEYIRNWRRIPSGRDIVIYIAKPRANTKAVKEYQASANVSEESFQVKDIIWGAYYLGAMSSYKESARQDAISGSTAMPIGFGGFLQLNKYLTSFPLRYKIDFSYMGGGEVNGLALPGGYALNFSGAMIYLFESFTPYLNAEYREFNTPARTDTTLNQFDKASQNDMVMVEAGGELEYLYDQFELAFSFGYGHSVIASSNVKSEGISVDVKAQQFHGMLKSTFFGKYFMEVDARLIKFKSSFSVNMSEYRLKVGMTF